MIDNVKKSLSGVSETENSAREKLGRHVTYFALSITGILAMTAIMVSLLGDADAKDRYAHSKEVLTIILPVIGTWVGTVLAFYFSRENFIAAATQTANLVRQLSPDQRLQSIAVTEAMIDMTATTTVKLTLAAMDDAAKLKLKADVVDGILEKTGRNRLPILDNNGKVLYVLHRSFIDKFLVKRAEASGTALADTTLKDILDVPDLMSIFQTFAVVGKRARLFDIKQAMDGNPNCSDAFITQDGSRATPAVGWVTNVIVRECSVQSHGDS
jgi:hypothetical protein